MTSLKIKRFSQEYGNCAVAACSAVSHYYDKKINYKIISEFAGPTHEGLWSPQSGILLNNLGFQKVTIVTGDVYQFDFSWKNLTQKQIISRLKKNIKHYTELESKEIAAEYISLLSNKEYDNNVIIDIKFGEWIRRYLDLGVPVMFTFDWSKFFNYPKYDDSGPNPYQGFSEIHQVVAYGYDEKNVFVLDSGYYSGKLAKYKNGRYRMDWETLHSVMGTGDLIIAENYEKELSHDELVEEHINI